MVVRVSIWLSCGDVVESVRSRRLSSTFWLRVVLNGEVALHSGRVREGCDESTFLHRLVLPVCISCDRGPVVNLQPLLPYLFELIEVFGESSLTVHRAICILPVFGLVLTVLHDLIVIRLSHSCSHICILLDLAIVVALGAVLIVSLKMPARFFDPRRATIVHLHLLMRKTLDRGIAFESVLTVGAWHLRVLLVDVGKPFLHIEKLNTWRFLEMLLRRLRSLGHRLHQQRSTLFLAELLQVRKILSILLFGKLGVVPMDHFEDWARAWQALLLEVSLILFAEHAQHCLGELVLEHVLLALHLGFLERQHPPILSDLLLELCFLLLRQ